VARRSTSPPGEVPDGGRRRGLGEARTYHPRGRTVRDGRGAGETGAAADRGTQAGRAAPARPALRVLDGAGAAAAPAAGRARRGDAGTSGTGGRREPGSTTAARTAGAARKRTSGRGAGPRPPRRPPRLADPIRRLRLGTAVALVMFAVLGLRLIELQLTEAPAYAASGLTNRLHTVVLPANRGTIYDRNGAVLAQSVEASYVYADPELVEDPPRVAAALSPLLGIPASELIPALLPRTREDGRPSRFAWIQRGVDVATGEAIMALNLPGIGVSRDERRIVPGHDLAANLIGFTGQDLTGLEGMEASWDDVLRGVNGQLTVEVGQGDLAKAIPGGYQRETPAQPGSSLRLTIDQDLQFQVQRILADRSRAARATFGAAVVLDPRTGEVLAQASYPTYDAADPLAADPGDRLDAATATVVDPGSVHKALVLGAALEEGVITSESTLRIDPTIRKGDVTFQDTYWHPPDTEMTLSAIIAFSSNVGTIMIADKLGAEKLYEYQRAFGLGDATGVGVAGEAAGLVQPPANWSGSSYGSVPIGHSVAVTPLQMAAAFGTIANDGVWVQPQLVREVIGPDGATSTPSRASERRVLSPDTATAMRRLLEAPVAVPNATGVQASIDGYRIAGKTGTGKQVVDGEYTAGEVASFVGMAPAEDPRYVVAVFAHTPGGGGGQVSAPAFRDIMRYTLQHYRVPPTGAEAPAFTLYP
jgi:cell division protein FtsI (penicillin-binding protein 3)